MAIMALNLVTGYAQLSLAETFQVMFHTTRGMLLPAVIVLLAAFYPRFGFTVRRIEGDTNENRDQIINAFRMSGYALQSESNGVMIFRAGNFLKKLLMLGEDEIKVSQQGSDIVLDGIRRGVARVQYRLESYLQMTKND